MTNVFARPPALSVNLNKIALLRNSRDSGVPDLLPFVHVARAAGAVGITLHPRPDERHIRPADVTAIAETMAPWRPGFELSLEGYPEARFFDICAEVRPEQVTLVPDAPEARTSDHGWVMDERERAVIAAAMARLRPLGCRIVLFAETDAAAIERIADAGATGIELYTGPYADSFRRGEAVEAMLETFTEAGRVAQRRGLSVNAGHDLNLANLPALVAHLPHLAEVSIGHELVADALLFGMRDAIVAYRSALGQPIEEHP